MAGKKQPLKGARTLQELERATHPPSARKPAASSYRINAGHDAIKPTIKPKGK
jgi:hypothetical protein